MQTLKETQTFHTALISSFEFTILEGGKRIRKDRAGVITRTLEEEGSITNLYWATLYVSGIQSVRRILVRKKFNNTTKNNPCIGGDNKLGL